MDIHGFAFSNRNSTYRNDPRMHAAIFWKLVMHFYDSVVAFEKGDCGRKYAAQIENPPGIKSYSRAQEIDR